MVVLNWVIDNVLTQTAIFMGLIAALGLVVQKKSGPEILEGALMTAVGQILFSSGSSILCGAMLSVNDLLLPTISTDLGVYPFSDNVMTFAYTIEYIGANIMQVFVIAWFIHILIVRIFNKYFKVVYLTVHMMLNMVACNMLFFYFMMGLTGWKLYVPCIVICVLYWTISPMLVYKDCMELSDGSFCLGHLQQFGAFVGGHIAKFFGDPEKDNADELNLPGWISMFQSCILNLSVTIPITFIVIGIIVQIVGNEAALEALAVNSGGVNWVIWMIIQGFTFTAGVAVLKYGLRIFLGSLVPAFQGFTDKIMPGVVPAIDCVAFFSFSPMGVIMGFFGYTLAGIVVAIGCILLKTSVFVFPSILLAFFDGGCIGIFANKKGGWKGALVACFICGLIMHIGSGVLAGLLGPAAEQGLSFGNFDTNSINAVLFWIINKIA